jgi:hypothetical protein
MIPYPDNLKIVVDFHHIADGRQCSQTHCPIAVSLRERFPKERIIVNSPLNLYRPGVFIGTAYYPHTEISARYVEQIDDPHAFTHPNTFTLRRQEDERTLET